MDPTPAFEIHWTRQRLLRAYSFMKILRVEPLFFLVMFQFALKGTPLNLLLQDKICRQWHHQNATYCHDLPTAREEGSSPYFFKSKILADVNQFGTYTTYITTGPALIWAIFLGAWIDRYVKARKILLVIGVGAAVLENMLTLFFAIKFDLSPYYMLLTHIPSSIMGGNIAPRLAVTHYMAATTPPKLMALRFMIFEMCMFVANPIGSSLGGYLLVQTPIFKSTGEIRNYSLCIIIATVFEFIGFLWIIFMIKERVARKHEMRVEMKIRGIKGKIGREGNRIKLRSDMSREDEVKHPLRLLFDLENVKSMVRTVIKNRPNKSRTQLFLVFGCMVIHQMAFSGGGHVSNTFIQKIYRWAPDYQAYMNSLSMVVHSIATISIIPFLIKVVKVADIPLAIIGSATYLMSNLIKGTFLTSIAFYVCLPVQAIAGLSSIGTRSHLTKIVGRDEIGKVMSFITAVDTLAPTFSSTLFTYVFNATIDTYPGTVFQMTAGLILINILVLMWIDLFTERPLVEGHKDNGINKNDIDDNKEKNDIEQEHNNNNNNRGHDRPHHNKYHKHGEHKKDQAHDVENIDDFVAESEVPSNETKL